MSCLSRGETSKKKSIREKIGAMSNFFSWNTKLQGKKKRWSSRSSWESTSYLDMNKIPLTSKQNQSTLFCLSKNFKPSSIAFLRRKPQTPSPKNNHNHSPINCLLVPSTRKKLSMLFQKNKKLKRKKFFFHPDRDSNSHFYFPHSARSKRALALDPARPASAAAAAHPSPGGDVISIHKLQGLGLLHTKFLSNSRGRPFPYKVPSLCDVIRMECGGVGLFDTKSQIDPPYYYTTIIKPVNCDNVVD